MSRGSLFHNKPGHFAIIYIDCEGSLRYGLSAAISNCAKSIFSPQVTEAFLEAVAQSKANGFPECPDSQPIPSTALAAPTVPQQQDRRARCAKLSNDIRIHATAQLPVNEKNLLRQYYERVFHNIQQTNCRVIAKVYIRLVEPRKQILYPYNGTKNVEGRIEQFNPKETKPPWWPAGVTHREPDHLPKAERIALLIHILCELRSSHGITARKLKLAGQSIEQKIAPIERLQLLNELYMVREEEEKFLDFITDGSTGVVISAANLPDSIVACALQPASFKNDETPMVQNADAIFPDQVIPMLAQEARRALFVSRYHGCTTNEPDHRLCTATLPFVFSPDNQLGYPSVQSGIFPIESAGIYFPSSYHHLSGENLINMPQYT